MVLGSGDLFAQNEKPPLSKKRIAGEIVGGAFAGVVGGAVTARCLNSFMRVYIK
jgi:hypothetical protein